ncbi:MAG TPA: glycosyltransferase family A protein [Candidatus Acidoferrum sp.]|nr:glycosyltransferase family A protein [Candidatus Acidoferrum sp.]
MTVWTERCTIGITTRDRAEDLRHTIERLKAICLGDMRYIIVDDGSADGAALRTVAGQLLHCRFVRYEVSAGLIQRRQEIAEMCETEFLISLDDDSYFVDLAGMEQAIAATTEDPSIGLVSFKIIQLYLDPQRFERRITQFPPGNSLFFRGCGYLVRVSTFLAHGGFPAEFRHGGEESHLQYQFFASGTKILHVPSVVVEHRWTWSGRPSAERAFLLYRSQPMLKLLNEPLFIAVAGCVKLILWDSWHGRGPCRLQFLGLCSGILHGMRLRGRWRSLTLKQYLDFRQKWRSCFQPEWVEAGPITEAMQAAFGYCPNTVARK